MSNLNRGERFSNEGRHFGRSREDSRSNIRPPRHDLERGDIRNRHQPTRTPSFNETKDNSTIQDQSISNLISSISSLVTSLASLSTIVAEHGGIMLRQRHDASGSDSTSKGKIRGATSTSTEERKRHLSTSASAAIKVNPLTAAILDESDPSKEKKTDPSSISQISNSKHVNLDSLFKKEGRSVSMSEEMCETIIGVEDIDFHVNTISDSEHTQTAMDHSELNSDARSVSESVQSDTVIDQSSYSSQAKAAYTQLSSEPSFKHKNGKNGKCISIKGLRIHVRDEGDGLLILFNQKGNKTKKSIDLFESITDRSFRHIEFEACALNSQNSKLSEDVEMTLRFVTEIVQPLLH